MNCCIVMGFLLGVLGMFLVFWESLFNLEGMDVFIGMGIVLGGVVCWVGMSVLLFDGWDGDLFVMFWLAV